jgi:hypothetical protein
MPPSYIEMAEQAKKDRAWRQANPDPNRCNACWQNSYRLVGIWCKILGPSGKRIGRVWRSHEVCNYCHPGEPPLRVSFFDERTDAVDEEARIRIIEASLTT